MPTDRQVELINHLFLILNTGLRSAGGDCTQKQWDLICEVSRIICDREWKGEG